ncbi:CPBP family intramembrane metalloprotease [Klebsiella oxytoca]|uniref:CPBP family intramembrane glutamic endopeptidase n=1 Tax=Klebsiella oxytoca TaxID=571 RepID=UPI001D6ADFA4|nr:CPBP family intramembrane metalloprotease [Klebsiella oxytoca]
MKTIITKKIGSFFISAIFYGVILLFSWISVLLLKHTEIITVNTLVPFMSSAIFITTVPLYLWFYKGKEGYCFGNWRHDLFFIFSAILIMAQLLTLYFQPPYNQQNATHIDIFFIANIIAICLISPVYEELIFRGVIYGFIKQTLMLNTFLSMIITSLLFISLHWYYHTLDILVLFFISIILTYARVLSNGVLLPLVLHILMNFFVLALKFYH